MMYGLGVIGNREQAVLRTLSPLSQRIILDELRRDPSLVEWCVDILRQPDPERALARSISEAVVNATSAGMSGYTLGQGLGIRMPKFSNIRESVQKVAEKVTDVVQKAQEVAKNIAEKASDIAQKVEASAKRVGIKGVVARLLAVPTGGVSLLLDPKIRKKAAEYAKKYGPMAIPIASIAVAFIPGVGIPLAAAMNTMNSGYQQVKAQRLMAKEAEKAGAEEAAALQAEADAAAVNLENSMNDFYVQYAQIFESAGVTREKWDAMSLDEKYAAFQKFNELIDAAEKEMAETEEADAAYRSNFDAMAKAGYAPERWVEMTLSEKKAALQEVSQRPAEQPKLSEAPGRADDLVAPTVRPPSGGEVTSTEARYRVFINGSAASASPSTLDVAMALAESSTSPGDKVEIFDRGSSIGLWVKTSAGLMKVPADQVAAVRAASQEELRTIVAKSEEAVGGKSGGFPLWLLAVPAAAYAVSR